MEVPMGKSFATKHTSKAGRLRVERGASAVEYGLLIALIAVALIAAIALFGPQLYELFQNIAPE
jgi:pilus assembly protein Flp/PilA